MTIGPEHSRPFGCYEPTPLQSYLIAIGRRLPRNWAGRRIASLIRSFLKRYSGRPIDVIRLGSRMRLYPRSNSSEKRLMATPQFFDAVEMALLETRLNADFVFLDVGANAGAYTLFVANRVGRTGRISRSSPIPRRWRGSTAIWRSMRSTGQRLCRRPFRSQWQRELVHQRAKYRRFFDACGPQAGPDDASIEVECRSLASLVREEGLSRIDAIKLDVEGAEDRILVPYLAQAPRSLLPRFLIIEDNRSVWKADLLGLLERAGYVTEATPNANLVLSLQSKKPAMEALHGP